MKKIANLLEMELRDESSRDSETDMYAARDRLADDLNKLSRHVDFYFGSAGDVSDLKTRKKIADTINNLRKLVLNFDQTLQREAKRTDQAIFRSLKKFM